jgi:hypothetical protein
MAKDDAFQQLKNVLITQNENTFGREVRERFGDKVVDDSNRKLAGLTEEQWQRQQLLAEQILAELKVLTPQNDPTSPQAQALCDLHRQWLQIFWADGSYSPQAHLALAEGYLSDERFAAYYDHAAPGATQFLRDALEVYCGYSNAR